MIDEAGHGEHGHLRAGTDAASRLSSAAPPEPAPDFGADFDPEDLEPQPLRLPDRRRVAYALCVLLALLLAFVLPPLLNVNRFRRQTANSIAVSLGRPVHMDSLTLNLLPLPGFTLTNLVVSEDPAFGSEPVIRAESVRATLRWSSLWRRRVEFSRIALNGTSVNLVHRADGRWNIESILLQASRIEAAPTVQQTVSAAPRFPYIEATDARVNVKMGVEKMPISLSEAEFALWLPEPQQWKLSLQGRPTRTDAASADAGRLRLGGTLGKAEAMGDVPVALSADWTLAPLGAVSTLLTGTDAGFRGEMNLHADVLGTLGQNSLQTRLQLTGVRRADFVPAHTLEVDLSCKGQASGIFRRLSGIQCAWPPLASPSAHGETGLKLTGEVRSVAQPSTAVLAGDVKNVPAAALLASLRLVSVRVAGQLTADGWLSGKFSCCVDPAATFNITAAQLALPGTKPFVDDASIPGQFSAGELAVGPIPIDLGGSAPATLEVTANRSSLRLHLAGSVLGSRLLALASVLPQLGDGIGKALPSEPAISPPADAPETAIRVDLLGSRPWTGIQVWTPALPANTSHRRSHHR